MEGTNKRIGSNVESMAKVSPEIYFDTTLTDKEKTALYLLKLKIFAVEDLPLYKNLIRKGYINEIPQQCRVLGKHVFLYHGISKSIYMN
jgi:hypothetical protein